MNFKLRLKNKATLAALIAAVVAFIYQICGIVGVTAPVSQSDVIQFFGIIINLLVALGVVVDPTTQGVKDSELSMRKDEPESGEAELVSHMVSDTPTSAEDIAAESEGDA